MSQSNGILRIKKKEVLLLFLWVLLMVLCLLIGKRELSVDADVSELYLCGGKDQNGMLLPVIQIIRSRDRPEKLSVCGHALTDGRPSDIDILIYFVDRDELIYNLPVGVMIPNGYFAYELPADILQKPGDYRIEATFAHRILITSKIEVIK